MRTAGVVRRTVRRQNRDAPLLPQLASSLREPRVACGVAALIGLVLPALFGMTVGKATPLFHDEHAYLLAADTFARGRLTNETPRVPEAFEVEHVLVVPSYQAKYPPAQGAFLAFGQLAMGHALWGVWISCGLFAGALCWMLQAWTSRGWAFAITLMTVGTLGTSTYWAQSYWGGMAAAAGGALVFGGLRRTLSHPRATTTVLMGAGFTILAISRPFEGMLIAIPVVAFLGRWSVTSAAPAKFRKVVVPGLLIGTATVLGLGVYNQAVTGDPLRLPYQEHQDQYFHQGVFIFSPLRPPLRIPPPRVAAWYESWKWKPARGLDLLREAGEHFGSRTVMTAGVPFGFAATPTGGRHPFRGTILWCLLIVAVFTNLTMARVMLFGTAALVVEVIVWLTLPLYPFSMAPAWLFTIILVLDRGARGYRWGRFVAAMLFVAGIGQALVALWYPHYSAPLVPLILAGFAGCVRRASQRTKGATARRAPAVAAALVVLNFGAAVLLTAAVKRDRQQPAPGTVISPTHLRESLVATGGHHVVFVEYSADYPLETEWVYNGADLESAPVMLVHHLGPVRDKRVTQAYPGRVAWLLSVTRYGASMRPYELALE